MSGAKADRRQTPLSQKIYPRHTKRKIIKDVLSACRNWSATKRTSKAKWKGQCLFRCFGLICMFLQFIFPLEHLSSWRCLSQLSNGIHVTSKSMLPPRFSNLKVSSILCSSTILFKGMVSRPSDVGLLDSHVRLSLDLLIQCVSQTLISTYARTDNLSQENLIAQGCSDLLGHGCSHPIHSAFHFLIVTIRWGWWAALCLNFSNYRFQSRICPWKVSVELAQSKCTNL